MALWSGLSRNRKVASVLLAVLLVWGASFVLGGGMENAACKRVCRLEHAFDMEDCVSECLALKEAAGGWRGAWGGVCVLSPGDHSFVSCFYGE